MATMTKNRNEFKPARKPEPVRIDDRGRISLPKEIRDQMGIESGDTLFMRISENGLLEVLKAINPFDLLVDEAIREYKEGKTTSIEDLAAELGVDLDSDD